jgi:hypothetical protein
MQSCLTPGEQEATFEDMMNLGEAELCRKAGYAKIKQCCHQALEWGFQYAWVDTCCTALKKRSTLRSLWLYNKKVRKKGKKKKTSKPDAGTNGQIRRE